MTDRTTSDPIASNGKYTGNFPHVGQGATSPQPQAQTNSHTNGTHLSSAAVADAPPPLDLIHAMLLDNDDETFSTHLVTYITTDDLGPHTAPLTDARVMTRLCALDDPLFICTLLTLAAPDHAGLDVLYDEAIMLRVSRLAYAPFKARFLPGVQGLAGFDVRAYLRDLGTIPQRPTAVRGFTPLPGTALLEKDIPDLEFIVEDILPVGATLFVGRAKDGKSLAMWNLALAVASGGVVFGRYPTSPGPVLYLDLEDGERRAKKRLTDQLRALNMAQCPEGFEVVCWDAPRVGAGLEAQLHGWLDDHPGAKLIIIDILEKVRPPRTRNGSVYADDYAAVAPLQRLAQERGIAIVIVHHTHKAKAEDFRDTPSGSMSLLGAVDTLWSIRRVAGERDAVLQITGRDLLETPELAMQFQDGFWTARGDAATTILNPAHQAIVEALRTAGYPMTPTQLATVLGVNLNTLKVHLMRLVERGLVAKTGQGQYLHRITPPESPAGVTPVTPLPPSPGGQDPVPPAPIALDLTPAEDRDERSTPLMFTPAATAAPEVPAPAEAAVTRVTPDGSPAPRLPATNEHTNGPHHAPAPAPRPQPPQFCPGCGAQPTWLVRETYYQCAQRHCGLKWFDTGRQEPR